MKNSLRITHDDVLPFGKKLLPVTRFYAPQTNLYDHRHANPDDDDLHLDAD